MCKTTVFSYYSVDSGKGIKVKASNGTIDIGSCPKNLKELLTI